MLTLDKITEIFCIADDFYKYFDAETAKMPKLPTTDGKYHRNRPYEMSQSEIITILLLFHFICNDKGELLSFCLTKGNIDDRDPNTLM
ncbi:MAG: transposase, partial [Paludibacter sp.]|nr:transposase [Paludibacter sp.]